MDRFHFFQTLACERFASVPFKWKVQSFDRALILLKQWANLRFEVFLSKDPIQAGALGHPFNSLSELVGMKTRIWIRQDRRDRADRTYANVNRIELFIVAKNDRAD